MPKRPALPPSPVDLVDDAGQPIGFGLAKYLQQLNKYGPDMLLETAAEDLSKNDYAILRYRLWAKRETHFFKDGRWHPNESKKKSTKKFDASDNFYAPPKCACGCGLDVPTSKLGGMGRPPKYVDDAHKQKAYRNRKRDG